MKVKIFSTPSCHFCNDAKAYFKEKGIPFLEINTVGNPEAISELRKISGAMAVPVIVVGDTVILGWDKGMFDDAYITN